MIPQRIIACSDRALSAFDDWFCSAAGVWQTAVIVVGIVIAERIFPHLDPGMFALMVWLTIYSGVTQPALAHTGRESAERLEELARQIERLLEREEGEIVALQQSLDHSRPD